MADVGGDSSGGPHDGYIPSYDAPTAPIPAIRAEDGTLINPRVPRRFPIGDGEETVLVPRPELPAEPSPEPEPEAAEEQESVWLFPMAGFPGLETDEREHAPETPEPAESPSGGLSGVWAWEAAARNAAGDSSSKPVWTPAPAEEPAVSPTPSLVPGPPPALFAPPAKRRKEGLLTRIGDIPVRFVYSVGAALVTALAVFLIFVLFSGDRPHRIDQSGSGAGSGAAVVSPAPSPSAVALPGLPPTTKLRALPGTPSPVLGAVTDSRAAITYAKLGKPWQVADIPSFSAGQQVGTARQPGTMVVSGLLPGASPQADLKTDAEFRKAAAGAVRWTVANHYPAGAKVAWTASQKPATGKGWTLGYRVTYTVKGKRHTSQAALTLLDIGRRKPAILFVTVPDTRKELWADIAPLVASARAL
ncbi:hypothetical protein ABZ470_05040 [Streptosporangium sp. NPDC020072]|uniref:hypothetical protein n=1 Tax=Streptosporangium sp. NPDC020072 TaxID=3154788 RepID=UPI0034490C46